MFETISQYDFIDSQSLQPEPPKTPQALPVAQQGGAAVGRPGKHRTPQSRKKPRTPMSALKKCERICDYFFHDNLLAVSVGGVN